MKKYLLVLVLAALVAVPAFADDVATPFTADEAFQVMKSFEGKWTGESLVVPAGKTKAEGVKSTSTVSYDLIANDTSIVATYGKDTPMEMLSLFHQDGSNAIIHTHYCAVGNQPSMKFEKTDKPGEIKFLFTHGTNMDVKKDGHVHDSLVRVIDENTLETESNLWRDGKLNAVRYTRVHRAE